MPSDASILASLAQQIPLALLAYSKQTLRYVASSPHLLATLSGTYGIEVLKVLLNYGEGDLDYIYERLGKYLQRLFD